MKSIPPQTQLTDALMAFYSVLSNLAKLLFIGSKIAAKIFRKIDEIRYHFGNTVHSLN